MSQRSILFFALAIVLALGAVWAARSWLEGRTPGAPAATVATVPVVVAGVGVPVGSALANRQLSSVDWPKRYVPDGAFSDDDVPGVWVTIGLAEGAKCARCWQVLAEVGSVPGHDELCQRCAAVVADTPAAA